MWKMEKKTKVFLFLFPDTWFLIVSGENSLNTRHTGPLITSSIRESVRG